MYYMRHDIGSPLFSSVAILSYFKLLQVQMSHKILRAKREHVGGLQSEWTRRRTPVLLPLSPQMDPTFHEGATPTKPQPQEPAVVQLDPKWYTLPIKLS